VGRKLEAKHGLDEQKPDRRLACLGKGAMDSDARNSPGRHEGKSGEGRVKASRFTPGGLRICPDESGLPVQRCVGRDTQKSAEVIVGRTLDG